VLISPEKEKAMARKSEVVGLRLRVPAGLHRLVVAKARENNRSLNSEVLWAIAHYIGTDDAKRFVEHMAAEQRRQLDAVVRKLAENSELVKEALERMRRENG
jgi:Arc-like DNA binding domain